jgi:hypothetical protein
VATQKNKGTKIMNERESENLSRFVSGESDLGNFGARFTIESVSLTKRRRPECAYSHSIIRNVSNSLST